MGLIIFLLLGSLALPECFPDALQIGPWLSYGLSRQSRILGKKKQNKQTQILSHLMSHYALGFAQWLSRPDAYT